MPIFFLQEDAAQLPVPGSRSLQRFEEAHPVLSSSWFLPLVLPHLVSHRDLASALSVSRAWRAEAEGAWEQHYLALYAPPNEADDLDW